MTESIINQIRQEILSSHLALGKKNVGTIVSIADGIAILNGLSDVMYNEMIDFANGIFGVALNLEEDFVGIVLLGEHGNLKAGDQATATGKLLSVPVGKNLLGRVVNAIGQAIDGKGPIASTEYYPIEKIAPGIMPRKSVTQPLQTGILAIDSMIPIGRGQRELIIGDRATGKSTIAIDTIINQAHINRKGLASANPHFRPVYSIYVAIGQKNSTVARTIKTLNDCGAMEFTIVVNAAASDNPANQYIAPYAGCAMGEWFMQNAMDALIVYDDLSKHAVAYRQICLILKRPSGREAYPGDVFYLHSKLLERAARLNATHGNGSLTALPIIETQAGDVAAYIPTNVISITDGQIFLDTSLFNKGIRPAISVGISVSRIGAAAQLKAFKQVAGKLKLELGQYEELRSFAQFGSDLDTKTQQQLNRGVRIVELFRQPANAPRSVGEQIILLWAIKSGIFDKIEQNKVTETAQNLLSYFSTHGTEILERIEGEEQLTEEIEDNLLKIVADWQGNSEPMKTTQNTSN
ncbi:MAG: F0F1 ATP synthase subunit alpha [Puniceicoccales bacterium]|jgi:F-type H+-transporting ATPase subunit alpha|nr:F0F1 ATP synthase subunit alpha [Puniceicoccales bacterium]